MNISLKLVYFNKVKIPSSDKKLNLNPNVCNFDYLF